MIDLRGRINSPGLYARLTWQQLFNIYKEEGGDLTHMDALLCDLGILTRWFAGEYKDYQGNIYKGSLYWSFDGSWTTIQDFDQPGFYKIEYLGEGIKISGPS